MAEGIVSNPRHTKLVVFLIVLVTILTFAFIYRQKWMDLIGIEVSPNQGSVEKSKALPELKCGFASNEEAIAKAKEQKSTSPCFCIKEENYKLHCKNVAENEAYFAQARAQLDLKLCEMIKNDSGLKDKCTVGVKGLVDYIKKNDPGYLANVFIRSGNYDGAIEMLQGKNDVDSMLSLALSYANKALNKHKEKELLPKAKDLIGKAKAAEPNNPEVYRVDGFIYEIEGKFLGAVTSYDKALEIDPNSILSLVGRGHASNMLGDLEKALSDFKKAAELDVNKENMDIYANLCRLETSRDDLLSEGMGNCLVVVDSPLASPISKGQSLEIIAEVYLRQGNVSETLVYLEKARPFLSADPNLFVILASARIAQGDYSGAIDEARKALEIDPLKTVAYAALSEALLSQKEYASAKEKALKGLDVIDNDPSLLAPNKPFYRQKLNYIMADVYAASGDKAKETQYREAGDKAMKPDTDTGSTD